MNIVSKFQLSSSSGFGFMMFGRSGGKASISDLIYDRGVCRTTLATPDLLISYRAVITPLSQTRMFLLQDCVVPHCTILYFTLLPHVQSSTSQNCLVHHIILHRNCVHYCSAQCTLYPIILHCTLYIIEEHFTAPCSLYHIVDHCTKQCTLYIIPHCIV